MFWTKPSEASGVPDKGRIQQLEGQVNELRQANLQVARTLTQVRAERAWQEGERFGPYVENPAEMFAAESLRTRNWIQGRLLPCPYQVPRWRPGA